MVKKTACPLLTTAEVFAKLHGKTIFSTMHLYQAYQQLRVDDETAVLLTVNTAKGLFRVKQLPFRISGVPATFQRIMQTTMARIQWARAYLNNFIVSRNDASMRSIWMKQCQGKAEKVCTSNKKNASASAQSSSSIIRSTLRVFIRPKKR